MTALILTLAVALDWLLGAPRLWHPLRGFERLADWLDARLAARAKFTERGRGILGLALLLTPPVWVADELASLPGLWGAGFAFWVLVFTLGHQRLHEQAATDSGPESLAATCARVLENGGVFGVLFWFLVAGAPGALLYRLTATLHARWGARVEFGWAATQLEDMFNVVPAHLAALTYALLGRTRPALECWREQAPARGNSNSAALLSAGGGALGIRLYDRDGTPLGDGEPPGAEDLPRALALLRHGVLLWLALICFITALWHGLELSSMPLPEWEQILEFLEKYVFA